MLHKVAGALLGLALAAVGPAAAQVADLTQATCGQLLELPRERRDSVVLWLHGYYAGAAQRAVIDQAKITASAEALQRACEADRGLRLIGIDVRGIMLGADPMPRR